MMCQLCGSPALLRDSHIIPKFAGRWMKATSPTPYLRLNDNMDKRRQDLHTMKLLCDSCENRFSAWETKFANEIFYPFADGKKTVFRYRSWLNKFAASLAWRGIHFLQPQMSQKEPPDLQQVVNDMEGHLSRFLLGQEKSVGRYTQHVYTVGKLEAPIEPSSPMLNRYLARSTQIDLMRNGDLSEVMMYVKLPMFIFLSVGESTRVEQHGWKQVVLRSRVHCIQRFTPYRRASGNSSLLRPTRHLNSRSQCRRNRGRWRIRR